MKRKLLDWLALAAGHCARSGCWRRRRPGGRRAARRRRAVTPNYKDADIAPGHRGRQRGHRQELHHRPARARAGHDAVARRRCRRTRSTRPSCRSCRSTASWPCPPATSIKIVPDANARSCRPTTCPSVSGLDEIVTQVIAVEERQRRAAGADPAAADAAVRPPRRLPGVEHADHLRPRRQREPHDAHHPAHRPGRRRGHRGDPAASTPAAAEVVRIVNTL